MKKIFSILLVILTASFIISCSKGKEMSPQDFLKIDDEIITSDMSDATKKAICGKYGFSVEDYDKFKEKVDNSPELKNQLGEIRLQTSEKK